MGGHPGDKAAPKKTKKTAPATETCSSHAFRLLLLALLLPLALATDSAAPSHWGWAALQFTSPKVVSISCDNPTERTHSHHTCGRIWWRFGFLLARALRLITAMLLILGGIEPNPGMKNAAPTTNKEKDLNQLVSEADSTIGQDICTRVLNIIAARHPKEAKEVTEMVFNMDASEVESLLKKPKYFEELVDDAVSLIKRCLAESDPLSKIETEMKVIPIARPKRAAEDQTNGT